MTASAVALNQTTVELGGRVEAEQLEQVPLNGRNWANLMALTPGAIDTGGSNQRSTRYVGRALDEINFTFDGVDATGIYNQNQKANIRLAMSTESIAEFKASAMLYSAEYGGAPGGQVVLVSKTGTNAFHGAAFEYFRNSIFDARGPFDPSSPPAFRLNQFGVDFGGPVIHNRTFFYANYEGYRQSLGQTLLGTVPTPAIIRQVRANTPSLAPYLDLFPRGTAPTKDPNFLQFTGYAKTLANENAGMIRIDHRFSDSTTAFVRYNADNGVTTLPSGSLGQTQEQVNEPSNGVVELLNVFSPALVNEAKLGFNRAPYISSTVSPVPFSLSVTGASSIAGAAFGPIYATAWSLVDDVNLIRGPHAWKAGIDIRYVQANQANLANGSLSYSSVANFIANHLDSFSLNNALPMKGMRKTQYFGYIQDDWKVRPNLTLDLGLRYEFFNSFHELHDRAVAFDFASCGPGGYCSRGGKFSNPITTDFAPRLGVAWSPAFGHGKTVFRAGAGIYYGEGQLGDLNAPIQNDVQRYSLTIKDNASLSYPIDPFLSNASPLATTPRSLARNRKEGRVGQWGASIQQELPASFLVTLSYVGSKGTHLFTRTYVNAINPATGQRPLPGFGLIDYKNTFSNSEFDALQFSLRRSFHNGLLVSANYMWSHAIDDGAIGGGEADYPENINCRSCERASGDADVRHSANVNFVYRLPVGAGSRFLSSSGLLSRVLGGWDLSGLVSLRTGLPVNITVSLPASALPDGNNSSPQRPNRVLGVPLTPPSGQTVNNWINIAAFSTPVPGTWGNLGRNAFRGPALWQADAALAKDLSLTERVHFVLRADVFNLLNRAQYANPAANVSAPSTFGEILTTVNTTATGTGTARQIQFTARVRF
ncbi:MAG: TonB-dependent receptor [Acidobacteriaceae bacterium]|nr:TonB-dependent receptor [Acidobacteriaceae bacterium]